jgi:hypothetical protein
MRLCPRRRTLTLTHFDQNFVWRSNGTVRITYSKSETKTGQGIQADLTCQEAKWFRLFEKACMPTLVEPGNRFLFGSSKDDKTMDAATVAREVCQLVRDVSGCDIHLHLFRALLATTLLAEDPQNNLDLVRLLLGHAPHSQEVEKYAKLSSLWATAAVRTAIKAQAQPQ